MPLEAGLSLSEINQILGILSAFVVPAIAFVIKSVRDHLKRIKKIEDDLNVAHARIRELMSAAAPYSKIEKCPLAKGDKCERS